ncbi:hypothetical protein [Streptomyces sp. NBC_01465]|uniref:hypothetical protein n=1 Tax=Streptomyces sp. NBC_01465 TaxID=2903878 RepID=UPI002E2EE2A9|nr:hypothetical protein [Streptomyces sp. NBC_01465]
MGETSRTSDVRRRGHVPPVATVAAVRAGLFSVLGTFVTVIVQDLAFESSPSAALAGWRVVVGHIVLALLCAVLLHGLDNSWRRVLYAAGQEWCALRALLRRLLSPCCTSYEVTEFGAAWRVSSGPTRAPPTSVLLAGAVVRRGPPQLSPPYTAA